MDSMSISIALVKTTTSVGTGVWPSLPFHIFSADARLSVESELSCLATDLYVKENTKGAKRSSEAHRWRAGARGRAPGSFDFDHLDPQARRAGAGPYLLLHPSPSPARRHLLMLLTSFRPVES